MNKWTRRAFIGAGTVAGGGFLLGVAGFTFAPSRHSLVSADAAAKGQLTTWITITPDNVVNILIPHCEMGQGTPTALAMMAAEELEADWTLVRVQEAPALDEYANGYIIRALGGGYVPAMLGRGRRLRRLQGHGVVWHDGDRRLHRGARHRRVGHARGRRRREGDAGGRRGEAVERGPQRSASPRARGSRTPASGRSATYGELARAAATQPVPTSPALKNPDSFTIRRTVGQAARHPRRRWMAARSTPSTSRRRACSTPRSRSRRCRAASWCRWTPHRPTPCQASRKS